MGRYDEAEQLQRETVETKRRVLGPDDPSTLTSISALAFIYGSQRRYGEAEALYREVLQTRRRVLGRNYPITLGGLDDLANAISNQRRYDEALELYLEELEANRRVLGADHPNTLLCMNNLANTYHSLERYDEAERFHRAALEGRRRVLGRDHPRTLRSVQNLAAVYSVMGKTDEARPLVAELLSSQRAAAEASEAGARTKNAYAWTMLTCEPADLQDPEEALQFALEANELTRFENPRYLDTLALAYHRTGQTATAIETQRKAISLLPEDESRAEYEERLEEFEAALKNGHD